MKTPYEKYKEAEKRRWDKFKDTILDKCEHPVEHVTSNHRCDEDEYGSTNYNRGTTTYHCNYCGKTWYVETKGQAR